MVTIQPPLYQQKWWLKHQFYEQPMLEYIRKHYHGGTFIDGGACIGNHTLWFATFCAQQVIAVEPVERNMTHLRKNLRLSRLNDKVTLVAAALGAQAGRGAMWHAGQFHGQWDLKDGDEVDVTTLDAIAALADYPVTLVKLDIEGSELAALQGGQELLTTQSPAVIAEAKTAPEVQATSAFLVRLGYKRALRFGTRHNYLFTKGEAK